MAEINHTHKATSASNTRLSAIDLISETYDLLKSASINTLSIYLIGTVPFLLFLLHFCSRMSTNLVSNVELLEQSILLTLFFIWMKGWQSLYAIRLRRLLTDGEESTGFSFIKSLKVFVFQGAHQVWGLVLLPISALILFPFGWVTNYYYEVTIFGDEDFKIISRKAMRQTLEQPVQNHFLLSFLYVFVFLVWTNLFVFNFMFPYLLKMLFGWETIFTKSGVSLFMSSTYMVVIMSLTYLITDPFIKAVYVLRSFYSTSKESGEDLSRELKIVKSLRMTVMAGLLLCSPVLFLAGPLEAKDKDIFIEKVKLTKIELRDSLDEVCKDGKYRWRLPLENDSEKKEEEKSWLLGFIESIFKKFEDWKDAIQEWLKNRDIKEQVGSPMDRSFDFLSVDLITLICVSIAVIALIFLVLKYRQAKMEEKILEDEPTKNPKKVDIRDQNLNATDLNEDEWAGMARDYMLKGEYRLALRAFYLSCLSLLGRNRVVKVSSGKSNQEYLQELKQKLHVFPSCHPLFLQMVKAYEKTWYGRWPSDEELLMQMEKLHQSLKTDFNQRDGASE